MEDVPMNVSTCWVPIVVNVLLDIIFYLTNVTASEMTVGMIELYLNIH